MLTHPTISAWQRQEDGSYAAEIHGYKLRVRWVPERPGHRRGFSWEVVTPSGTKGYAPELHEEIECAMAEAEGHVPPGASG